MFLNHLDQHSEYNYLQPKIIDDELASLSSMENMNVIFLMHFNFRHCMHTLQKYENEGLAIINSKKSRSIGSKIN